MKKITIITAICISIASIGNAQDDNRKEFQFGLKAGLNLSNVYDEKGESFDADPKLGFVGGVSLAIPIGKVIGIQPEILISQKGFHARGTFLGGNYTLTKTTTYLDVPVLLALKPIEFVTIFLGPQYSYLLKQRDELSTGSTVIAQVQEFENKNIRKNIFGVVGGADVNIQHFVLGARLAWDVQHNKGDGTSTNPRYKNVWYQLTVGYKFF
jgi:hypothetical protein